MITEEPEIPPLKAALCSAIREFAKRDYILDQACALMIAGHDQHDTPHKILSRVITWALLEFFKEQNVQIEP